MCRSETSFLVMLMILARSLVLGSWLDVFCVAGMDLSSLVHCARFLRVQRNGMVAGTFQPEARPVVWNGLRAVSPKHVLLSCGQGTSNRILLCQVSIETLH